MKVRFSLPNFSVEQCQASVEDLPLRDGVLLRFREDGETGSLVAADVLVREYDEWAGTDLAKYATMVADKLAAFAASLDAEWKLIAVEAIFDSQLRWRGVFRR